MIPRIVPTPIAPLTLPTQTLQPRRVTPEVLASTLPGPGRDKLADGAVLAVTTGQQPGLFTGPLYTVYKALSAIALAQRLERALAAPVVPVFWVAGDDHDFAEANHAAFLNAQGDLADIVLRERPADAPLAPLARERCGAEIRGALDQLKSGTPDTEFKADVVRWLEGAYRPEVTLADACAEALQVLLAPRGLAVLRAHDRGAKQAAAPWLLRGLGTTLPDGYTPVFVEAGQGRDRLQASGDAFVTRRSQERFTRVDLERLAREAPERLSPNVLLRPVIEAALLPTLAYAAGPAELKYLPDAAPLYDLLGVARQAPVPRWSGVLVEGRVEKLMQRYGLGLEALDGKPGELEARLVRESLPPEATESFGTLRQEIEVRYAGLARVVSAVDPTLERTVQSARNAALVGTQEIEKKLIASLKRESDTLLRQISRARDAVYPRGEPQERVLTLASFLIRYGPGLLDALGDEVARWADAP
ncbi:MAG: hypothetical protein AUH78_02960 [Gemmatimonadetes bacterium 13_1_40CM_4_69_8]|nr:MAG: hypothetical protein AUH78_02960 [Gemmatimonadetes bacterium 13_1_40CM_4_69_8]